MLSVPRGRVAKPRDSYVKDNGRTSVLPKFQNEQEVDVKSTPAISLPKKNHDSVMSRIDMEFLPPRLPPFYPFEKISLELMVPFKVTIGMLGSVYKGKMLD
ncbi:hypothetical protein CMV_026984 [Castanea mollissima]|uniref:Uncharacterized protein n=1 Tax=Castanea mollissima TaxID=60419 RepID=A0A8J4QCB0_9ROSI|nr:hypothetical protein CMV_026984 [Castanea mollissima]